MTVPSRPLAPSYTTMRGAAPPARIEEEVVVGANGVEVLTRFPARELYVTNPY